MLLSAQHACRSAHHSVVFLPDCVNRSLQVVKAKVQAEDGRGRFKTTSDKPLRIADREKKPALKT
jgi:hypothetical protein